MPPAKSAKAPPPSSHGRHAKAVKAAPRAALLKAASSDRTYCHANANKCDASAWLPGALEAQSKKHASACTARARNTVEWWGCLLSRGAQCSTTPLSNGKKNNEAACWANKFGDDGVGAVLR